MVTSWLSITPRVIFEADFTQTYTCHTYPVIRQVNFPQLGRYGLDSPYSNSTIYAPKHDKLHKFPWINTFDFATIYLIGSLISSFVISIIMSYYYSNRKHKNN